LVRRIGEFLLAAVLLLYGGDFVRMHFRSQPTGQVEVHQFYAVRLKGKKVEYMPLENADEICSHSLFPQLGYLPCWYVERHRIRQIDVGN
jgi:hypothetical protein